VNEAGTIYRTQHEIEAAQARGERLEYLDKETARAIDEALNRHERRRLAKLRRQAAKGAPKR
jgi:uncharacterized protein YpiB (UPF0302 family)